MELSETEARAYQGSTLMCTDELILTPASWLCVHVPVCNEQILVDGKEQKTSGWILLTQKQWTLPCLCSLSHDNSLSCPQAHLPALHTNIWISDCVHMIVSSCPSEQLSLLSYAHEVFFVVFLKRHKCDHFSGYFKHSVNQYAQFGNQYASPSSKKKVKL